MSLLLRTGREAALKDSAETQRNDLLVYLGMANRVYVGCAIALFGD